MAKRSRKVAAKYSQLSKEGKKRHQRDHSPGPRAALPPRTDDTRHPTTTVTTVSPRTAPKRQNVGRQSLAGYEYVRDDLKRIGILTGAVVVILVILTFTLG